MHNVRAHLEHIPPSKKHLEGLVIICCGVRWLFRKKAIESARLSREVTWEETIIGYKGYWKEVNKGKKPQALQKLQNYYKLLRN